MQTDVSGIIPTDYTDFHWGGEYFLIADDDNYTHLLLDRIFKKTGANLIHAYNGQEAIDVLLRDEQIKVALIDIVMPVKNGYEVVEQVYNRRPDIKYVAFTADIFRLNIDRCLKAGFSKYLSKPLLPARLFEEIASLISQGTT